MATHTRPYLFRLLGTATGYAWAMVSLVFFIPVGLLSLPFDRRQRVHDRLSTIWARGILFFAGCGVAVQGTENVHPSEHYVIVSNHQSLLDTMIMLVSLQPLTPVRLVAKRSLFGVPLLGWGMRAFGHMGVDHRSIRASMAGLQQAQSSVATRWSTVFFAEGTRSPDGRMLPFHSAAFHIAARAGVRVLPVTISGSVRVLPKRNVVVQEPGRVAVRIHAPMGVPGTSQAEVHQTAEACRRTIESALGESA
jgi:1-acyl-sn-glycerol-3-phosphate acyltransferase